MCTLYNINILVISLRPKRPSTMGFQQPISKLNYINYTYIVPILKLNCLYCTQTSTCIPFQSHRQKMQSFSTYITSSCYNLLFFFSFTTLSQLFGVNHSSPQFPQISASSSLTCSLPQIIIYYILRVRLGQVPFITLTYLLIYSASIFSPLITYPSHFDLIPPHFIYYWSHSFTTFYI